MRIAVLAIVSVLFAVTRVAVSAPVFRAFDSGVVARDLLHVRVLQGRTPTGGVESESEKSERAPERVGIPGLTIDTNVAPILGSSAAPSIHTPQPSPKFEIDINAHRSPSDGQPISGDNFKHFELTKPTQTHSAPPKGRKPPPPSKSREGVDLDEDVSPPTSIHSAPSKLVSDTHPDSDDEPRGHNTDSLPSSKPHSPTEGDKSKPVSPHSKGSPKKRSLPTLGGLPIREMEPSSHTPVIPKRRCAVC
ncbi:hypothetical protein K439DRAFT_1658145 [Ramaria rubella]|nr:hypothetical protein K439DRAFT_1658145 [Ramaria rubella]